VSSGARREDASALAWAEQAYALVQRRPRQALALAERALAAARAMPDVDAEIAARRALGWAQIVVGEAPNGRSTLRAGIRLADRHGDRRGEGLLRRLLAVSYAFAGETRAANRELGIALDLFSGRDRAQSQVHRLEIFRRTHAVDPVAYRRVHADAASALRLLRREGNQMWEARLLFNRGLLHLDRGELTRAELDLRRAHGLSLEVGADDAAIESAVVLAELALLRGDVLGGLKTLDEVESRAIARRRKHEHLRDTFAECRVMALLQARLLPEARAAADEHLATCLRMGRADFAPAAMLELAAIALMSADAPAARRHASSAVRRFAARGKPVNAALARSFVLRAQLLDGEPRPSSLRSGLEAAAVLERAGWRREALRTRLLVARLALAVGSFRTAREQLELAGPLRSQGTVSDRIELCHARALLRVAEGRPAAAERLLANGLALLDGYRAALGDTELRATASGIGVELSRTGLRLALESGRPAKILAWAERLHGNSLRLPPVRPSGDAKLAALQADLRRVAAQARAAEHQARRAAGLAARRAELESAIRSRTHLLRGEDGAGVGVPDPRVAARALGDRALVEYVELDGATAAITLCDGRLAVHELPAGDVKTELEWLRFALARVARGARGGAERAAARAGAEAAAAALDRQLVEPLLPVVRDAPLVVVPTGPLHALPWGALPSLRGRPVTVAPSLSVWLDLATRAGARRRKTALVAGPRLRHAADEVRKLAALLPGARVLHGDAATAAAALAALDGAALAHLACHGTFRADSPLFSALELADGPLNVYELQRLRRAPDVVVLSACELASSGVHPGDELLGLAAALLGMGTRTIVASAMPVSDAATRKLMLDFYGALAAGETPAAALAGAQAGRTGATFVCLGHG
jgi:tetratricopeptide (TPR) repeat protein